MISPLNPPFIFGISRGHIATNLRPAWFASLKEPTVDHWRQPSVSVEQIGLSLPSPGTQEVDGIPVHITVKLG